MVSFFGASLVYWTDRSRNGLYCIDLHLRQYGDAANVAHTALVAHWFLPQHARVAQQHALVLESLRAGAAYHVTADYVQVIGGELHLLGQVSVHPAERVMGFDERSAAGALQ